MQRVPMNCTELDLGLTDIHAFVTLTDVGFGLGVLLLFGVSVALLLTGERCVRPLASVVSGVSSAVAVFLLTGLLDGLDCYVRLGTAGGAALVAALLSLCLLKTGLFVLGAGALGTLVHYLYDALPLASVPPPFVLFDRSGWYYLAVTAAGLVGGVVSQFQRTHFIRISAAVLGGGGVALCVHLLVARAGDTASSVVLLVIVVVCTFGGILAQRRIARWRRTRKQDEPRGTRRRRRRAADDEDDDVPTGRPVFDAI